jgi:predicted nucleic acid-binding Zn ribbon protein
MQSALKRAWFSLSGSAQNSRKGMAKYDMYCAHCDEIFEVEHPMREDNPTIHDKCGGPITRYFEPGKVPSIQFISSRGGGVDDWASKVAPEPQHQTSDEEGVPYE